MRGRGGGRYVMIFSSYYSSDSINLNVAFSSFFSIIVFVATRHVFLLSLFFFFIDLFLLWKIIDLLGIAVAC